MTNMFSGKVIRGKGRGKALRFPTINLKTEAKLNHGIYVCKAKISGEERWGLLHIGPRPVFGEKEISVEVHLLDFQDEKVPQELDVEIVKFLREVKDFKSEKELIKQMEKDREEALKFVEEGE